ncbi:hypothetical protein YC2023_088680 [Brassica napus]
MEKNIRSGCGSYRSLQTKGFTRIEKRTCNLETSSIIGFNQSSPAVIASPMTDSSDRLQSPSLILVEYQFVNRT